MVVSNTYIINKRSPSQEGVICCWDHRCSLLFFFLERTDSIADWSNFGNEWSFDRFFEKTTPIQIFENTMAFDVIDSSLEVSIPLRQVSSQEMLDQ